MMFAPVNTRQTYAINHDDCAFLRRPRPAPVPPAADETDPAKFPLVFHAFLAVAWIGFAVAVGAATWAVCWMFGVG